MVRSTNTWTIAQAGNEIGFEEKASRNVSGFVTNPACIAGVRVAQLTWHRWLNIRGS